MKKLFKLVAGTFTDDAGKCHKTGDVVASDRDLSVVFKGQFQSVEEGLPGAPAPVAPLPPTGSGVKEMAPAVPTATEPALRVSPLANGTCDVLGPDGQKLNSAPLTREQAEAVVATGAVQVVSPPPTPAAPPAAAPAVVKASKAKGKGGGRKVGRA